jgi:hypothetical protein
MEGNMRGPSSADCEKSFYRTGQPTANMLQQGLVKTAHHRVADPDSAGRGSRLTPAIRQRRGFGHWIRLWLRL